MNRENVSGADKQVDRKRVQNRIAQRCCRERRLTHVRRLESLAKVLESSNVAGVTENEEDRYGTLLRAHLKLLDEHKELEEALLRLRKKLLSVSSSVSSAAGNTDQFNDFFAESSREMVTDFV